MNGSGDEKRAATTGAAGSGAARHGIPAGVWVLGFVSMLMDISSEMIHALLPLYMVTVLGTSTLAVGIIEGIAEATASITKVFSGALSDWLGKRKALAAFGYGLAALPGRSSPGGFAGMARLPRASSTASARAFAARRAMPSLPTSRHRICAAQASACANRSTRSALFWGRFSPSA